MKMKYKLNHFAIHQKQCKSTILQLKKNIPPIYTIVPGSFHFKKPKILY